MGPIGTVWNRIRPYRTVWEPYEIAWDRMGTVWHRMEPHETYRTVWEPYGIAWTMRNLMGLYRSYGNAWD